MKKLERFRNSLKLDNSRTMQPNGSDRDGEIAFSLVRGIRREEDAARTNEITRSESRRNRFQSSTLTRYTVLPRESVQIIAGVH